LEEKFEQLKALVKTLRSRNLLLSEENSTLKAQIQTIKTEMSGKLFDSRAPMTDLIKTIDELRDMLLSKKKKNKGGEDDLSPTTTINNNSAKLARDLMENGDVSIGKPRFDEI
jgi:hypothetical protein